MIKMNLRILTALLCLALLVMGVVGVGGCASSEVGTPGLETPTQIVESIAPQEAFTLIQDNRDNPGFVILDVRTPGEVAEGYIESAINIDFYSATFRDELNRLDKDKTYLIYCRSGNRSRQALRIMGELNFREVYDVAGGIVRWQAEGLPTTK